jgi:hypothetical protein
VAEKYPLEIENIGEDVYTLMSRGHHDIHDFMRKVRAEGFDWPLRVPEHVWMHTRPAPKGSGYRCFYDVVEAGTRGAWPATYVSEGWHDDAYEAKFPAESATAASGVNVPLNPSSNPADYPPEQRALLGTSGVQPSSNDQPKGGR